MKNILFLADSGAELKSVYHYAFFLAQKLKTKIHSAYFFNLPIESIPKIENTGAEDYLDEVHFSDDVLQQNQEWISDFVMENTPENDIDLLGKIIAKTGNPIGQVQDIVKHLDIGLIVMGMNQKNKLENALFGNLSLQMIEKTNCPLLLVPRRKPASRIKKIVFATDFKKHDLSTVRFLSDWAAAFDAQLHILHIAVNYSDHYKAEQFSKSLKRNFLKEVNDKKIVFTLLAGDAEAEIEAYSIDADMLVLTPQIRNFWSNLIRPNMTEDLVRKIEIPVLVIKLGK